MGSIDEEFRKMVKENYDFSSWAGKTKYFKGKLCENFFLHTKKFEGWSLEEKEELPTFYSERSTVQYIYNLPAEEGKERIAVAITVREFNSILEAHEALIDLLMTYMAPYLPRCEEKGLNIGDVCFGGHGDLQTSVIFTRYNILVRIDSVGTKDISVKEFAETIDSQIIADQQNHR
ncbi:MAG: hypothetical protein HXS46_09440 [Theionarchaea archaeon]|nr:MAG: hypothetical protein AYK18_15970 [Theionarchaea archaeon DG-70]MBU7010902.1 hypothetical protein [Theionarchaea archaeon]